MVKDMTTGNPFKLIVTYAIPLILGNVFQQAYSIADLVVIGRYLGAGSLAAVGSVGSLSFMVMGFVMGMTSGFSVSVAQHFGAGDGEGVRRATAMAFRLGGLATIALTGLACVITPGFLQLMQTPADIYKDAYDYIIVIFAGLGATMLYNLAFAVIRALGDSRTPLAFLVLASGINIGLDIVFIRFCGWGVAGAAAATVLSQLIAGVLSFLYMFRSFPQLHLQRQHWRFDPALCAKQLRLATPMAFQFSIIALGAIILQSSINAMGSAVVAAYTAGNKIEQMFNQPLGSYGVAVATYCAQNHGAGKISRIQSGVRKGVLLSMGTCVLMALPLLLFPRQIVSIFFADTPTHIVALSVTYLVLNTWMMPFLGLLFIFRNALQGLGNSLIPFLACICELITRVWCALILVDWIGYPGLCLAGPLAWVSAVVPLYAIYKRTMASGRGPASPLCGRRV